MKKNRKKIGIITVYSADYGSYFQATALNDQINKMGYESELLYEKERFDRSAALRAGHFASLYFPKFLNYIIARNVNVFRTYLVLQNDIKNIKISKKYKDISEKSKEYDCIVIGSDELWSATNPKVRFFPIYFALGVECPHISYGTSAITLKDPEHDVLEQMQACLMTFKAFAVRDGKTADLVRKLTGKDAEIVLDPALLNPYYKVECTKKDYYIVVYGEHFTEKQRVWIKDFAKSRNTKLKSVSWKHKWCDEYIELDSAGGLQEVFAKSQYCMSSTFHGTIFSIIHHLDFTSFLTELRGIKILDLLKMLHLEKRIFLEDENNNDMKQTVDFEEADKILKLQREKSERYLCEQLESL